MGEGEEMGKAGRSQAGFAGNEPVGQSGESHPEVMESAANEEGHPPHEGAEGVHKASEHSIWPFVLACGLLLIAIGAMGPVPIAAIGVLVALVAVIGWMWQPWTS